ncbi:hypothetical protein Y032_0844g2647 [Ancylostoma ceylanicum]|uniref:SSD domain-containing protein n=2 Tax=Ancylostoma ceylanicum TaxID=53326 RepID=A0A016WBA6_9BILA|nr:hypothetical protein Y032_0844g2647 [Ancylostoma ceylanicum]
MMQNSRSPSKIGEIFLKEIDAKRSLLIGKLSLFWSKMQQFVTLRVIFYTFGLYVGEYPRLFLLLATLMSLTSFGMWNLTLQDSIQEGYTALDARSRYEFAVMRQFSGGNSAGIMKVIVVLMAKDGGSMHRKAHFDEAEHIVNGIYNLTVKSGERRMEYRRLCEPYCGSSKKLFFSFKKYFDITYKSAVKHHYYSDSYNLSYPFGSIWGVRIPLEKALYGVRLVNSSKSAHKATNGSRWKRWFFSERIPIDPNKTIESQITNMEHVSLMVLFLYGNKSTPTKTADLTSWELGMYEWSKQVNKGEYRNYSLIKLLVFGTEILNMEINTSNRKLSPYFGAGFSSMIGFVALCVFSSAYYYDALDLGKILVGIGATLCPLLAITSTYGVLSLMGSRINSLLFVMPFLIMGVGVDAAFLMVNSWQKLTLRDYSNSERLGLVYEAAMPSISITSVTNVLSFTIGAITPTPEVRVFCFGTATSMGLTYVYQLILFGPVLSLAAGCEKKSHRETKDDEGGWRKAIEATSQSLLSVHSKIVRNKYVAVFILAATFLYWGFAISGVLGLEPRLDATKILPKDSLLHEANSILTDSVWREHLAPSFYVNIRFNMTDQRIVHQFWDMLKELESLPNCRGHASSYVWFRNFVQKSNRTKEIYPYNAQINPEGLNDFLRNDEYHFENSLKLSNNSGNLTIEAFFFNVAYTNVINWDIRIGLMTQWREITDRYPALNTTVYESGAMFVDQMLSLKRVTLQTALLTFLSMTAVCAIFMRNPCTVATASVSIASISTGVIGIMSKLHFELDPIVMASLLMTIGMSVDYIAHVAYHFQLDSKTELVNGSTVQTAFEDAEEKLEHTMRAVAWPMAQAGLSTVCCVLPLLFVATYASSVFVTAIILVVLFGVLHGLFVLPAFLSLLPEWLTSNRCCRRSQLSEDVSDNSARSPKKSD